MHPALLVVFMSGCCNTFAEPLDGYRCLQKPFKSHELVSLLAEALTVRVKMAH